MAAENHCQRLQESLMGSTDMAEDPEHLASCGECRQFRATIETLGKNRSNLFSPPPARLVRSILNQAFPPPAGLPWPLALLTILAAVGILVFSSLALYRSQSPSSVPQKTVSPAEPRLNSPAPSLPLAGNPGLHPDTRRIIMTDGEHLVSGPDGTQFELSGRVDIRILDRGFILQEGVITAHVKPGKTPFIGKTPHGTLEVLGTVFKVMVKIDRSYVSVHEGKVRVKPLQGSSRVLTAAETLEMSATPDTFGNASSTWACPPGQETIQR